MLGWTLFVLYTLAVISLTLLLPTSGYRLPPGPWFTGLPAAAQWDMNLVPFVGYPHRQIVGNVALGVPFGLLLSLLTRWRPKNLAVTCCAFGFGIETLQLVFDLAYGGFYRTVDITDALLNSFGALGGLSVAILLKKWTTRGLD